MLDRSHLSRFTAVKLVVPILTGLAAILLIVHSSAPHLDEPGTLATCNTGAQFEKLTCDDSIKVTKCFDAKVTCRLWKTEDCCSPIALHKCLNPLAGRGFGADCSSPIDAREECCADPETHKRAFRTPRTYRLPRPFS